MRCWWVQYDAAKLGQPRGDKRLTPEQQRIRGLERENQRLHEDVSLLKSFSLLPGTEVIQQAIDQRHKQACVSRLCSVRNVTRSGFYAAQQRERESAVYRCAEAAFQGSRCLSAVLKAQCLPAGRHRRL